MAKHLRTLSIRGVPQKVFTRFKILVLEAGKKTQAELLELLVELGEGAIEQEEKEQEYK